MIVSPNTGATNEVYFKFQFHYGMIVSLRTRALGTHLQIFQFHYGMIVRRW